MKKKKKFSTVCQAGAWHLTGNRMKRFGLLLVFVWVSIGVSSAQEVVANSDIGYYIKDGKVVSGVAIEKANRIDRSRQVIIPAQVTHPAATFYPTDIEEYGFVNERRYVSGDIISDGVSKKVFLEEVFDLDSIVVYCYPDHGNDLFFLQKKGGTIMNFISDPEEFWNLFRNSSCPDITTYIDLNKKKKFGYSTLNVYRRAYTDCNTNLLPRFHFGITAEAGISYQTVGYNNAAFLDSGGISLMIGAFAQIPIDECFSFRPEILFGDDVIVQVPLVFRHNFNYKKGKRIPYIDLGLLFAKKKVSDDGILVDTKFPSDYGQDSYILANSKTNPFRYGFVLGGGIEYKHSLKRSLYAGVRFKYTRGDVWNEYKEEIKSVTLNIAYGF